mgnify:CR=1 FL=1
MGMKIEELKKELLEIKNELREEYLSIKFDDDLIEFVGTLPCFPAEKDRDIIRETVERFNG